MPLQTVRHFENAALAFYLRQFIFVAAVGDVFAENQHARVASHLILQAGIDEIHHRLWLSMKFRRVVEVLRSRIHARRIDVPEHGIGRHRLSPKGFVRSLTNLILDRCLDFFQLLFRDQLFKLKELGQTGHGVALRLLLAHFLRFVEPLIVR